MLVSLHHARRECHEHLRIPRGNESGICKPQRRRCNLPVNNTRCISTKLDANLKKLEDQYSTQLVESIEILCKDGKMVIPKALQHRAVSWYHHYLQHPGHTRLEETLRSAMYWKGMRNTVRKYVKNCRACQVNKRCKHKYGKLPTKFVITNP